MQWAREENEERLCQASINGDADEVHRLLASGVNPNFIRVDMTSHPLWENALCIAASMGNIEVVKLLLKFGADPNIQNSRGKTPLHAARCCHDQLVKELLLDTVTFRSAHYAHWSKAKSTRSSSHTQGGDRTRPN